MKEEMHDIRIIRSGRKTLSLEITRELQVLVRAPFRMPDREILRFLDERSGWISAHRERMREKLERYEREKKALPSLTEEEIRRLKERALAVISQRAAYFAPVVGVSFGKITIRKQATRWGSCSGSGNLSFNCLLMLLPPDVIDYVVVHELCHRKVMNHSEKFWAEVARVLPDYIVPKKWLKENGATYTARPVIKSNSPA